MSNYITTDWLNLRSEALIPEPANKNVIAVMPPDTVVEKLADGNTGKWFHVKTMLGNHPAEGYTSSRFLEETEQAPAAIDAQPDKIPEVHLPLKQGAVISRNAANGRAYHLSEPGMVKFDIESLTDAETNIRQVHEVLNWLDVEHGARYAPSSTSTYCNIYAHDFAYCCGLYLPRVWWTEAAFKQLEQGITPDIIYEKTVTELNANSLTNWFENYGSLFGWQRVMDVDSLQQQVNAGSFGIIVAQRINLNRSGHIVSVVPETGEHKAQRDGGNKIISPLQSQAGAVNKKYFTTNNWWSNPNKFRKFGLWVWQKS